MKIYIVTRNDLPVGAYRDRDAAKDAALAEATKGVKFSGHAWTYLVGATNGQRAQTEGGPSLDRARLSYRAGRRWIDSGYVIDTTELSS